MATGVLTCLLLAATPAAAQVVRDGPAHAASAKHGAPWWLIPLGAGSGALVGLGAGGVVGLIVYSNECGPCWGGGDAWLTGGLVGAGIGAGVGLITTTIIVLATRPSTRQEATAVLVAGPDHAYAGVRVAF